MMRLCLSALLICLAPALPSRASEPYHGAALAEQAAGPPAWHPQQETRCLRPGEISRTPIQVTLATLFEQVEAIEPASDPLLQRMVKSGTQLCLEDRPMEARGYFDYAENLIVLRAGLERGAMLAILVHEMRHLDQTSRGFCTSTDIDRRDAVRLTFAMEADAQAIATLYAWHMKILGDDGPWQSLLGFENYADITQAFGATMAQGGTIEAATAAAFAQWYKGAWRTEAYYVTACSAYLEQLEEQHRLHSYDRLPEGFFDQFCRLPDGGVYACSIPPDVLR